MAQQIVRGWEDAFDITIGIEGGFSQDQRDPGNWTGGRVGVGRCDGTKYGISAAAFPGIDIADLSLTQAQTLAKQRYWDHYDCDALPPLVGWLVFDTFYNGGHPVQWLQTALGVKADGQLGPVTLAALREANLAAVCCLFAAERMDYWRSLPIWATEGRGWASREATMLRVIAATLTATPATEQSS